MSNNLAKAQHSAQQQSQKDKKLVVHQSSVESYQGALPHPEHLERYERTMPGITERIVAMTEKEGDHRRELEKDMLKATIVESGQMHTDIARGQWCALVIAVSALGVAALLAMTGNPGHATGVATGGIGAVAAAFVLGRGGNKDGDKPQ